MASTADGRALTAVHQREQQQLAARTTLEARILWGRLDIADLDGSTPYWVASSSILIERRAGESQQIASRYLTAYRAVEAGSPGRVITGSERLSPQALRFAGPVRVKRLIAGGMDPEQAYEQAFTKFGGIVTRQVLMGGRITIANTASADRKAVGWRRVTDGDPCAFCALLASRGPAFKSRNSTIAQGQGLRYHGHCGCTAEIVYSTWEPTADEQKYVDAYRQAADTVTDRIGRTNLRQILAVMRSNGYR